MKFYLIQRGKFNKDGNSLTGKEGVVDLDYMGHLNLNLVQYLNHIEELCTG